MKRPANNCLRVTDTDRCRLGAFLASQESRIWGGRSCRDKLEVLLERSKPVDSRFAPETLVTMNTALRLVDLRSDRPRTVTLVYPDNVDLFSDGISILDPLGTALLGCQVGDVIQCPVEQCQSRFRVDEVVFQPERKSVQSVMSWLARQSQVFQFGCWKSSCPRIKNAPTPLPIPLTGQWRPRSRPVTIDGFVL